MSWAVSDIPGLSNKTILITGANTGVGFHAAKLFAANSARVIMACRNVEKMAAAAAAIKSEFAAANLVEMQLDLSDLDSVRTFAETLKRSPISKIDVLLLNAGVANMQYQTSKQGYELMFATNHLGHWLLTGLLLDYIKDVPESRIVVVSSIAHKMTHDISYDVAKGENEAKYSNLKCYSESKLANQWFVQSLQKRLEAASAKTTAVVCQPGWARTELGREAMRNFAAKLFFTMFWPLQHSAEQGALPLVMASTDSLEAGFRHGNYYEPKNWFGFKGPPIRNGSLSKTVFDGEKQEKLWQVSEELTGFVYAS